jgi:hypothetical protein
MSQYALLRLFMNWLWHSSLECCVLRSSVTTRWVAKLPKPLERLNMVPRTDHIEEVSCTAAVEKLRSTLASLFREAG